MDCGQHLLLGAYRSTLELLGRCGGDEHLLLHRSPLTWVNAQGRGLKLRPGPIRLRLAEAILRHPTWSWSSRAQLLRRLWVWQRLNFQCEPTLTVAALCNGLPSEILTQWVEPLCVAALNTRIEIASASVFLRVLKDGVFHGPGASDYLIPRVPLGHVFSDLLSRHLEANGGAIRRGRRIVSVTPGDAPRTWRVEDRDYDRVILACGATEASRLVRPLNSTWAAHASALKHDAIVTTWIHSPGTRLAAPLIHLCERPGPAQFLFDLGAVGHPLNGAFTAVSSAPQTWLDQGVAGLEAAVAEQLAQVEGLQWSTPPRIVHSIAERRATFVCSAGVVRPPSRIETAWGDLHAAGDYVDGPYPATIEGAVRSGLEAAGHSPL
jgi:hypothetical protein